MTKKTDKLRDQEPPTVLGHYELDRATLLPLRQYVDVTKPGDYGYNPVGDGNVRMHPSGEVVSLAEAQRRLGRK